MGICCQASESDETVPGVGRDRDSLVTGEVLGGVDDDAEQLGRDLEPFARWQAQFSLVAVLERINNGVVVPDFTDRENYCVRHSVTCPFGPPERDDPVPRLVSHIILRTI